MNSFHTLSISDEILQAIDEMGFTSPSPIQEKSIPPSLEGKDIIGQAQTGTGKTAAFAIPILEKIKPENKNPQALIICPTRELAVQVADEVKKLGQYKKGIRSTAIYGGEDIEKQIKRIKAGTHIIAGTPGRIQDHLNRRTINFDDVETVVLDEADEMLDMGFVDDIRKILQYTPSRNQTLLFSATIPKEIEKIARDYQHEPEIVKVINKELTSDDVEQRYYEVRRNAKIEALTRLVEYHQINLGLIFCNTKKLVDFLADQLNEKGIRADGLHGDMSQQKRIKTLDRFKKGQINLLIATDVAARGIDINNVDAVFNYDISDDIEFYVHRIGRTGRAGKKGKAFTFVSDRSEMHKLRDIQRYTKSEIQQDTLPGLAEIEQIGIHKLKDKIKQEYAGNHRQEFNQIVAELTEEGYSPEELAAVLMKMLHNKGKGKQKHEKIDSFQPDLKTSGNNKDKRSAGKDKFKKERNGSSNNSMIRLFVNVGRDQDITPGDIINAFSHSGNFSGKEIGKIDIKSQISFVDVPKSVSEDIISGMNRNKLKGHTINIEVSEKN